MNFSKLSGDDIQNAARNAGMNFAVDLVIPMGPVGLNLGAGWSQKGVEDALRVIDLSYIEVPLHIRFPLIGAGPVGLEPSIVS